MKLLGRDIPARELIARIEERLRLRGLPTSEAVEVPAGGVEPRVEPLTFNLQALEEHADPTRGLPLHTHRGGAGRLVVVAKWAFRKSFQVFINEALGRQRVFNGYVRDSYAQLSAEVIRLRREVEQLRARPGGRPPEEERPVPAKAEGAPKPESVAKAAPAAQPASAGEPRPSAGASPAAKVSPMEKPPSGRESRPGAGTAPAARASPTAKRSSTGAVPSAGTAAAAKASPTAQPASTGDSRSSASTAPAAKPSPGRRGTPATKAPRGKSATHRKPASESGAAPQAAGEAILPRPRHARSGESQQPRTQESAPRSRPEAGGSATPSTGHTTQRASKPGSRRRGRRK